MGQMTTCQRGQDEKAAVATEEAPYILEIKGETHQQDIFPQPIRQA